MADIINSVDRSLDMYIYDLYIYRYISLSIYRSIFLYLFWLADIFASVERPDNKSLHLADTILIKLSNLLLGARQHHTTSGSVLFLLWPLTDGKFANLPSQDPHQAKKKQYRLYTLCPFCCLGFYEIRFVVSITKNVFIRHAFSSSWLPSSNLQSCVLFKPWCVGFLWKRSSSWSPSSYLQSHVLFKPYTREIKAFFDWVPYHLLQRPLPGNHEETHAHLETGHTQSRRCLPAVKIYFIYIYMYKCISVYFYISICIKVFTWCIPMQYICKQPITATMIRAANHAGWST
jgi:hypothetical protein